MTDELEIEHKRSEDLLHNILPAPIAEMFKDGTRTIGDAYFVAGGVPLPLENHTEKVMKFAIEMQEAIKEFRTRYYPELELRIGIHCGPVMAGVLGTKKFTYDLWGDTVNTASRMEPHGVPGRIHIPEEVYTRLKDLYTFDSPRLIEIKGKGEMETYLLAG